VSTNKILWGSDKNALIYLIGINFIIFFFFRALYIIFQNDPQTHLQDYNGVIDQFILPGKPATFLQKPWTLLTYFFSNISFMSLLSNMVWLFSFAYLLQIVGGNRYVIPSYIYGGLVSGVVFIITNAITGHQSFLVGSTTATLSIAATTVAIAPKYKIFPLINGGIPIWLLFVLFVGINVLLTLNQNISFLPSYMAAAAIGYFYGRSVQKGYDFGGWMHWIYNEFLGNNNPKKTLPKEKTYYKNQVVPFTKERIVNQNAVDEVLDKISTQGLTNLTDEERTILNKAKDKL
jgi:membrane associated rhomboid family serine protease